MATVGYTASDPNEAFMTTYLRYQLAPFMCRLGVEECLQSADRQFAALKVIAPAQPVEYVFKLVINTLTSSEKGPSAIYFILLNVTGFFHCS